MHNKPGRPLVIDIDGLIASYPRKRPELTERHKKVYVEEYKLNRSGRGLFFRAMRLLESWNHNMVSRGRKGRTLLELGSGTLNHVPYEHDFARYDCVEPFKALYEDSPHRTKVAHIYDDLDAIPDDCRYDRIFSICVLEHLVELPLIISRCARLMRQGAVFQASIPSEGGFLWGLSWRMTTAILYRLRTGLKYGVVMRHEHVNTAREIEQVLRYFFQNVTVHRFPFFLHNLSLYTYLEASGQIMDKCLKYIELNSKRRMK